MYRNMVWRAAAVLVASALLATLPALAAPPPAGSYRDSCSGVRAAGNVLRARCERNKGRPVRALLASYSTCVGDISNYDGRLICLRRDEVPDGSWSNECVNPRLAAPGIFAADCRSLRGGRITSQLALAQCPEGMGANRGRLVCEQANGDIVLYDRLAYRGRAFATSTDVPNVPAGFNDKASSARVVRGLWQVCTDGNYRGRCVILRSDTPNLISLGVNDRVSSLRRLPEAQYPGGDWRQSCRNASLAGPLLTAACMDRRGRYRTSTLDLRDCRAQIVDSEDGKLVCSEGDDGGGAQPPGDDDNLPPGSYRQTCRNEQFDGRRLRAECRDRERNWRKSELDTRDCDRTEEIVNDDGELACRLRGGGRDDSNEGPNEGPSDTAPPAGSYQRSCRNVDFDGRILTAQCQDERGKWRNARLDTSDCGRNTEIVNDDGDLACRPRGTGNENPGPFPPGTGNQNPGPFPPRPGTPPINPNASPSTGPSSSVPTGPPPPPTGGPPPPPPAGPPGAAPAAGTQGPGPAPTSGGNPSAGGPGGVGAPPGQVPPVAGPPGAGGAGGITLFDAANFAGQSKTFAADVADLASGGWNDLAASLRIARGRWELCTDANFAGRCETFNADQASLAPELDHKISSLRRVRRDQQDGQPQ